MTAPRGPAGIPAPAPRLSPASPLSQALALGACTIAFVALGTRLGSLWMLAPTAALLVGVALGIQLDLRRHLVAVPGLVAGLVTVAVLSVLWGVAFGWMQVELPYPLIPLVGLVAVGADWWWVERLRPITVVSGAAVVGLVENDLAAALPLAVLWFGVAAAALWSLRRDAGRALPSPVPLAGGDDPRSEPGAGRTAAAVAAAWIVAAALVALVGLVPTWFAPPALDGRIGADAPFDPGSRGQGGSGSGGGGTPGGDIGPGTSVDGGILDPEDERDVDGDGIPDRDIDGDGIPDVDLDGDGVPDIDRDGDGIPDAPGEVDGGDGAATVPPSTDAGPETAGGAGASEVSRTALRVVGGVVVALLAATLVALAVRGVRRELARRRALAARPWAVRLAERIDREGARRGRARRRDEPVTRYTAALAGGVLPDARLADVGVAVSAALFGAGPPADATGTWAVQVVDEAVAAHPPPRWYDPLRDRLRRAPQH